MTTKERGSSKRLSDQAQISEEVRASAEAGRESAEVGRVQAEGEREQEEGLRRTSERGRDTAELLRSEAEEIRSVAEEARHVVDDSHAQRFVTGDEGGDRPFESGSVERAGHLQREYFVESRRRRRAALRSEPDLDLRISERHHLV